MIGRDPLSRSILWRVGVTELGNNKISLPPVLTEPKFNQQLSGLYGFIYNTLDEEHWWSKSAELLTESLYQADNNFTFAKTRYNNITIDKIQLFNRFSCDIEWVNDDETTSLLRIVIAHDARY